MSGPALFCETTVATFSDVKQTLITCAISAIIYVKSLYGCLGTLTNIIGGCCCHLSGYIMLD